MSDSWGSFLLWSVVGFLAVGLLLVAIARVSGTPVKDLQWRNLVSQPWLLIRAVGAGFVLAIPCVLLGVPALVTVGFLLGAALSIFGNLAPATGERPGPTPAQRVKPPPPQTMKGLYRDRPDLYGRRGAKTRDKPDG